MSEEEKGTSGAPGQEASGQAQEYQQDPASGGSQDTVKYETYKKTLGEAKKYKSQLEELQDRLSSLEQEKLQAEGNKEELIESLKKEVNQWKGKATKAVSSFAKSKVHEAMMREASKAGCQDPELVLRAYAQDLDEIDFDDQFNPDLDQLKTTLERVRQERPYLFGKEAPKIGSHQVKTSTVSSDGTRKPVSKMTEEELMEAFGKTL